MNSPVSKSHQVEAVQEVAMATSIIDLNFSYATAGNGATTLIFLLFNPILCLMCILVLLCYKGPHWSKKYFLFLIFCEEIYTWLILASELHIRIECHHQICDTLFRPVLFALVVCSSVKSLCIAFYAAMVVFNLHYSKDTSSLAIPYLLISWSVPLAFKSILYIAAGAVPLTTSACELGDTVRVSGGSTL